MKILHVFGRMNRGGAEMRTLDLMRHLEPTEYRQHYCVLSGLPGDLDETIRSLGGAIHYLSITDPMFCWRFMKLLRRHQYDVVQSHVHYPSGLLLMLSAYAASPVRIAHFRSSDDGRGNSGYRRIYRYILKKLISRYATHILAVSGAAMDGAWGMDWRAEPRCSIIYNGIDQNSFSTDADDNGIRTELMLSVDTPLYIHVGRFDVAKNHLRVLSIFAEVVRVNRRTKLLLVGRGGTDAEFQARGFVERNSLHDNVIFAGVRDDVPRLLAAADILIFPSLWEGLPGAVLEASAVGIPVIASDLPVIQEISSHLPLLRCLSLSVSDSVWAEQSLGLCVDSMASAVRQGARKAFSASPFTIEAAIKSCQTVWRSCHDKTRVSST
jgi:glycosyltransferase involved in cell wall biosynthesis